MSEILDEALRRTNQRVREEANPDFEAILVEEYRKLEEFDGLVRDLCAPMKAQPGGPVYRLSLRLEAIPVDGANYPRFDVAPEVLHSITLDTGLDILGAVSDFQGLRAILEAVFHLKFHKERAQ